MTCQVTATCSTRRIGRAVLRESPGRVRVPANRVSSSCALFLPLALQICSFSASTLPPTGPLQLCSLRSVVDLSSICRPVPCSFLFLRYSNPEECLCFSYPSRGSISGKSMIVVESCCAWYHVSCRDGRVGEKEKVGCPRFCFPAWSSVCRCLSGAVAVATGPRLRCLRSAETGCVTATRRWSAVRRTALGFLAETGCAKPGR
jgi:hypothetical protein